MNHTKLQQILDTWNDEPSLNQKTTRLKNSNKLKFSH